MAATKDPPDPKLNPPKAKTQSNSFTYLLFFITGIIASILVLKYGDISTAATVKDRSELKEILGEEGSIVFNAIDQDGDFTLTPAEFVNIVERLTGKLPPGPRIRRVDLENTDEAVVELRATFEPMSLETLRSASDEYKPSFWTDSKTLSGIRKWETVSQETKLFTTAEMSAFLPDSKNPQVGKPWRLYEGYTKNMFEPLSHERYLPPKIVDANEAFLNELLLMFHPRPFTQMRFDPNGGVAVVRAESEKWLDIWFRFHAEFQLNEAPALPFWFTPAQFTGNIVISKDGSSVKHFHLYVPSDRKLNIGKYTFTQLQRSIGRGGSKNQEAGLEL
ncbi:unnamed protein product [Owenia fusiformis]|uniref:Uncharacterized protein n=1 Tax=Owenia fusiformis TaxID=6347 RepID=A0A8J1TVE3_OWEFU|nr:unnamed protein product [Owenia fusiformis]